MPRLHRKRQRHEALKRSAPAEGERGQLPLSYHIESLIIGLYLTIFHPSQSETDTKETVFIHPFIRLVSVSKVRRALTLHSQPKLIETFSILPTQHAKYLPDMAETKIQQQ